MLFIRDLLIDIQLAQNDHLLKHRFEMSTELRYRVFHLGRHLMIHRPFHDAALL